METTIKNELKNLDIKSIVLGNTNPRKTFDEKSDEELRGSIWEIGLLQPILVRPIKQEKYELVCGERRFRACREIMASHNGRSTIPALIRELTDDEAFEMQVTENLERKDVHPLEEAEAFKKMLDSGKYTIADLAIKFVKSETFIAKRIKLTHLIDEVKKDFYEEKLGIGHAMEIARLDPDFQMEIFNESNEEKYWKNQEGYGTLNDLKETIEGDLYNLDDAPFDTKDETLVKTAGACTNCPKRSGANPILFPDVENPDKCFDRPCFRSKTKAHIEKETAKILNEGQDVHLLSNGADDIDEFITTLTDQFNVKILNRFDHYQGYCLDGSDKIKGFHVNGRDAGKYDEVYLTSNTSTAAKTEDGSIESQIVKIEERAARSLELDGEKVWAKIREMDKEKFINNDVPLTRPERLALFYAIKECSYKINLDDEITEWFSQMTIEKVYTEEIPENILCKAIRILIVDKLIGSYGSHISHEEHAALKAALEIYYREEINAFAYEQQEIAEKRIARTNERLEKLREKQG